MKRGFRFVLAVLSLAAVSDIAAAGVVSFTYVGNNGGYIFG